MPKELYYVCKVNHTNVRKYQVYGSLCSLGLVLGYTHDSVKLLFSYRAHVRPRALVL